MSFKKSIQTILLGFALYFCVLFSIGQTSVLAATFTETGLIFQERMPAISEEAVNLKSGVNRFLTSIPPGYYAIASVEGLKNLLKNPQTVLVDVREPSEYKSGHIPNAINIPLRTLTHNLDQIPRDSPLPAFATVTQIEEYPGQMLYQSRQNLRDQAGNSWQASLHRRSFANAFKRIHPEGSAIVSLRLIGFYGGAELNHTQPLTLTTSLGQTLTARDISSEISQDTPTPANVGEYDIKLALSQLQPEIPLQLILSTIYGESVSLSVPSAAIQEWHTLISH